MVPVSLFPCLSSNLRWKLAGRDAIGDGVENAAEHSAGVESGMREEWWEQAQRLRFVDNGLL
jgi:hypothetical protein